MKLYYALAAYEDADFVVVGLPYDRTSSFIPGSRFGPEFIRICSENVEAYSPYQEKSLSRLKICDFGDVSFSTKDWMQEVQQTLEKIMDRNKRFIFLGGEHTVTLPVIKEFKKVYTDFSIIQFDAHCDLRDEYCGERICHATVMRRLSELVGFDRIYQFGIRSGIEEEFRLHGEIHKFDIYKQLSSSIDQIKEPIYLSIDADVLNPGFVPAVSTPEPGGVTYWELVDSLLLLKDKDVIGADIVEYNPLAASPYASGSTVAEVLRELILVTASKKKTE